MALPITQKILKNWAGWKACRDGKMLFEHGVVEKVNYEHPVISGQLAVGIRGMRCKFELLENTLVRVDNTPGVPESHEGRWKETSRIEPVPTKQPLCFQG